VLLTVNGEAVELAGPATMVQLFAQLGLDGTVAVERNGEIVPRNQQAETDLAEGDVLEIVQFVGGG